MKLATVRTADGTAAARVDGDHGVVIDGVADVGALLARQDWHAMAEQAKLPADKIGDFYQGGGFCSAEYTADNKDVW